MNLQTIYSQNVTAVIKNDTWVSNSKNLNIWIELEPKIPIIDGNTSIQFDVKSLNYSNPIENLSAKVTVTDHDGRLYKFEDRLIPLADGQFPVNYIFPYDGEHRIIVKCIKILHLILLVPLMLLYHILFPNLHRIEFWNLLKISLIQFFLLIFHQSDPIL